MSFFIIFICFWLWKYICKTHKKFQALNYHTEAVRGEYLLYIARTSVSLLPTNTRRNFEARTLCFFAFGSFFFSTNHESFVFQFENLILRPWTFFVFFSNIRFFPFSAKWIRDSKKRYKVCEGTNKLPNANPAMLYFQNCDLWFFFSEIS